ncbi:AEC family transporter [Maritimibacter sp. DP1N21-5]|uniref:AEC family transporter n=1 Tax=Maritimibacter sp. DP1N21-5 TaxID=2836867 RepID=UPI001C43CAB2|nr:AEC family transporter [Maritimibacter sp. DP1N21-5]MBV7410348.1 AEC family transporter [Maritimibacter sp. DP1N21-5]
MSALITVILPVFLVLGFGYLARWKLGFTDQAVDGLMKFAQSFGIPVLLFRALSTLELGEYFTLPLMLSFYSGALAGFFAAFLGARFLFRRDWPDCVAIGFVGLFSNAALIGLPIMERAYGPDSLNPNYAIIAIHAPFCYVIGITAMEIVRSGGQGILAPAKTIVRMLAKNPMVIGIVIGLSVNLSGIAVPAPVGQAVNLVAAAALPAALFGLGGILVAYRPEGDLRIVAYASAVSLFLHPVVTYGVGQMLDLGTGALRGAVLTAAMAPGVNAFLFANMYGVAKRVAATTVLSATVVSILTIWVWLHILP